MFHTPYAVYGFTVDARPSSFAGELPAKAPAPARTERVAPAAIKSNAGRVAPAASKSNAERVAPAASKSNVPGGSVAPSAHTYAVQSAAVAGESGANVSAGEVPTFIKLDLEKDFYEQTVKESLSSGTSVRYLCPARSRGLATDPHLMSSGAFQCMRFYFPLFIRKS